MNRLAETSLLFLDASRDNPLSRNLARSLGTRSSSIGRGLARIGTGRGTLVSFATEPGNIALDGRGANSPYTTALVKHLGTRGESLADTMIRVRRDVMDTTNGRQVPWEHSSLTDRVVLKEKPEETGPSPQEQFEITFWQSIKDSNNKVYYDTYLSQFPEEKFAPIARLKISEIKAAEAAHRQRLEAEREAEADRLAAIEAERQAEAQRAAQAEAERLRLAQEAEAARKAADESRLAAEQRLAELEAIRKQREEEEARRADELAAAEAARKAYEQRLVELEAQKSAGPAQEIEVALLEQPADIAPDIEPQIDPKDDRELVRSIQQELNRLGCPAGKADGLWGRKTERALGSFAKNGRIELATLEPSADVLNELRRHKARICPLVCGRGFEEKDGRCVRIPQTASVPAKLEQSRATQPAAQKPQSTTPQRTNSDARPDATAYSQRIKPQIMGAFQALDTKYGTIHCNINFTAHIRKCHWVD